MLHMFPVKESCSQDHNRNRQMIRSTLKCQSHQLLLAYHSTNTVDERTHRSQFPKMKPHPNAIEIKICETAYKYQPF